MLRLIALILAAGFASEARACPEAASGRGAVHLSARQLATPRQAEVRAGGSVVLDACARVPGHGHLPFAPTAIVHYTADLAGRGLEIRSEGACRPVVLVRTARGHWIFGDSAGRANTAQVVLANPATGRYAIWVGTEDAFGCDARLAMRSVRPTRFGLRTAVRPALTD
jgi:hypothetical protein